MSIESREEMLTVLPNGFGDNQGLKWIDLLEDLDSHFLRIDKPMFLGLVEVMCPGDVPALFLDRLDQCGLHLFLLVPAFLIGRESKISVCNEHDRRAILLQLAHGGELTTPSGCVRAFPAV